MPVMMISLTPSSDSDDEWLSFHPSFGAEWHIANDGRPHSGGNGQIRCFLTPQKYTNTPVRPFTFDLT